MLQRKIQYKLEEWYKSVHYKAPLLYGARQVGKTTAVREFANRHYKHFVEVNFVKHPIAIQAFNGDLTTKTIVTKIHYFYLSVGYHELCGQAGTFGQTCI